MYGKGQGASIIEEGKQRGWWRERHREAVCDEQDTKSKVYRYLRYTAPCLYDGISIAAMLCLLSLIGVLVVRSGLCVSGCGIGRGRAANQGRQDAVPSAGTQDLTCQATCR